MSLQKEINLVEVTTNGCIQIRELSTREFDGEIINSFHRRITDSTQDLTDEHELVKSVAALFPFIEKIDRGEGGHNDVSLIRVDPANPVQFRYDITLHVVKNGKTVVRERKPPKIVYALDDVSALPQKVQDMAGLIFTPEVKAAEQARLDAIEAERIAAEEKAAAEAEAKRIEAEKQAVENAAAAEVERIRKQEEFEAAVAAEVAKQLAAQ